MCINKKNSFNLNLLEKILLIESMIYYGILKKNNKFTVPPVDSITYLIYWLNENYSKKSDKLE